MTAKNREGIPWALYCRVSTVKQNLSSQEWELKRYAEYMLYPYKMYTETESTRNTRPVKEEVLNLLRRREIEGVIVVSLDRWARNMTELVMELEEFYLKDHKFISIKEGIDLSSSTGRLHAHILSAFADYHREYIREKTLLGLENARARGKQLGRPPGKKDGKQRNRRWQKRPI